MMTNAQSEIQIVDTHESLGTLINVDVAADRPQFNRTLVEWNTQPAAQVMVTSQVAQQNEMTQPAEKKYLPQLAASLGCLKISG
jgi:hypothetical protein